MTTGYEIRELLTRSQGTEGSLLIQKKIYDTLINPVLRKRITRAHAAFVIAPDGIPGSSIDLDLATPLTMKVTRIAEGAAVPIKVMEYTSINLKPAKYGVRPMVTKEMQEDGKWDLIAHNIEMAGLEMAYNEDKIIIQDALDNASSDNLVTVTGAAGIANLHTARKNLANNDYEGSIMFCGPKFENDLMNLDTFYEAHKYGDTSTRVNGFIGRISGMDVIRFSPNVAPSTTYTNYAYIIDPKHAFCVAEKRPVTIERYDDVTHDLSGVVVTQRFAASAVRALAMAKITTT